MNIKDNAHCTNLKMFSREIRTNLKMFLPQIYRNLKMFVCGLRFFLLQVAVNFLTLYDMCGAGARHFYA